MSAEVVIVGGGLAGLAAAAALARAGVSAALLESRPRLGGRASSFLDKQTETWIDNCQHVTLGCCTNFQAFCELTGLSQYLRREACLYFVGPDGAIDRFESALLPAPLHLWPSLRRMRFLSRADRTCIARGLRALAKPASQNDARPFLEWLGAHAQTNAAIERFWKVILVSALSESLDRVSVPAARKVIVDGFLGHRRGWEMSVPRVPLGELYGDKLAAWLTSRGVTIRLKAGVERLIGDGNRVTGAVLRGGETIDTPQLILATPQDRTLALCAELPRAREELAPAARLETAPISSVHLWFDRPITELPHAVFVERVSQWLFRREGDHNEDPSLARRISGDATDPSLARRASMDTGTVYAPRHYYQVVISASRDVAARPGAEIIDHVVGELRAVFPEAASATLLASRLVTEHSAVFSPLPGSDALRPPQQTAIRNLQLAGDWTRTGWPATMEGAVRSGFLAANNVLVQIGHSPQPLAPDLPRPLLSRWLFGV